MNRFSNRGFTLMEMVVTLTMLALMSAFAGPYLTTGVQAYNETTSAVQTLSKLRLSSERLAREIRAIRRDPAASADFDISTSVTGPNSSLTFTKTDTETVSINTALPLITLAYASVAGTHTLTDEVSSLTFRYLQADGTSNATGNDDLAFIEFELVLVHAGNSYPQRSRVALRNQP